jgi:gliding motility-associated-like protein
MKKHIIITFLVLLGFGSVAQEFFNWDNLCFAKMDSIRLYSQWTRGRVLDFNKDGKKDFVVVDQGIDSILVFINDGTANFTVTPTIMEASQSFNDRDICIADFNGDTYIDVAVIDDAGYLYLYKNNGGTSLLYQNTVFNSFSSLEAKRIEASDLNNDGLIDIIGTGNDNTNLTLNAFTFQSTGGFSFASPNLFNVFNGHPLFLNYPDVVVSVADLNGDAFKDFVVASDDVNDTLEIYQNLGTTSAITFSSAVIFKHPMGGTVDWILAQDLDGDTKPDLAVSSAGGFSINKGSGSFGFSNIFQCTSAFGKYFEIKDIDSDGNKDLIIASYLGDFSVFRGTTTTGSSFKPNYTYFNVPEGFRFLLDDFDGNSIPDFVFVGTGDFPYLINFRNFSFHLNINFLGSAVICPAAPVNLLAAISNTYPGIFTWSPGSSVGPNLTVTSSGSISTVFSYTLPPGYGYCYNYSDSIYIPSALTPTASISSNPTSSVCAGTPVTLTATVPATSSYTWSTGPSTPAITVNPVATTVYTLNLNNGCPGSETITVNVNPNPNLTFAIPVTTVCSGDSVQLNVNGANTYSWSPISSSASSVWVKPAATTNYSVIGTNSFGCSDTSGVTITVNTSPIVTISATKPIICFPDTTTLIASGAGTYTWSTGSNSSVITATPGIGPSSFTVTGSNGCKGTASISISILPRPTVTAISSKTAVCSGDSVTLTAFGAASYTWASPFQFGNSVVYYPASLTTYSVLGLGSNGCYNYTTVIINSAPAGPVSISTSEICFGQTTNISGTGALTYTWNTGYIGQNFQFTPAGLSPVSFSFTSVDANGCKSSASQIFQVSEKCQLVIYNGVTPNGDGNNDYFRIENIEQYPGSIVYIYNRWGQKLNEIRDYDNAYKSWPGIEAGGNNRIPSGTYYYIIDLL